jgi:thioredoxin-like negative regulator of GroEL
LGEAVPLEALESRSRKNPENASFRLTYALGLLKSGSKVKALFELKDVEPSIQVGALLPHQKAVYATIVAANGQVEEAQGIIKTISFGSLTRQEEALVSPLSAAKKAN